MHLTNVAVQKRQGGCSASEELKWPLRHLRLYLMTQVGQERTGAVFEAIQQIIIRSLLAVQSVVTQDKHCFEIYGYDVLLDRQLKPWLIEVNASPSLQTDSADDYKLKSNMVQDALTLVDVENRYQGRLPVTCGGCDASIIPHLHGGARVRGVGLMRSTITDNRSKCIHLLHRASDATFRNRADSHLNRSGTSAENTERSQMHPVVQNIGKMTKNTSISSESSRIADDA